MMITNHPKEGRNRKGWNQGWIRDWNYSGHSTPWSGFRACQNNRSSASVSDEGKRGEGADWTHYNQWSDDSLIVEERGSTNGLIWGENYCHSFNNIIETLGLGRMIHVVREMRDYEQQSPWETTGVITSLQGEKEWEERRKIMNRADL